MGGLRFPFLPEASAGGHSRGRHRPRAKCDRRVIRFGRATAHRAASRQVYYSFCSSYPSVGLSRFIREFGAISARPRSVIVFNHIAHTARSSFFRHFDPVTEEGEILEPESQRKLGNLLSGERFKSKLKGLERTGCCWSLRDTAVPRSGARALRPFDSLKSQALEKNPWFLTVESETPSSSPL